MIVDTLMQGLGLWLLVVAGDTLAITYIYKRMTGVWWWVKPATKPYSLHVDSDGWAISGTGTDPLTTLRAIVDNVTGRNKTMRQLINDEIRGSIQDNVREVVRQHMAGPALKEKVQAEIEKALKESLGKAIDDKPEV